MAWSKKTLIRFWNNVNKQSNTFGDNGQYPTECWEWTAGTESGYGRMYMGDRLWLAHRASWMIHNKSLSPRMCVCHRCDNRKCVRPDHLFIGTLQDNVDDRQAKGRSSGGRNGGGHKGEKNGRAKLTLYQVQTIKELLHKNQSGASIAREYGVTKETIYAIKHGRNWSHA